MTSRLEEKRKKTYKREFAIGTFFGCLFWAMWSGDNQFLQITFAPSLAIAGAVMGLHEVSENIVKRGRRENNSFRLKYEEMYGENFEK